MLTTKYLKQRLDQIVCDAFIEGGEAALRAALSAGNLSEHLFPYSKAKTELSRLMTEIIQSDGE